MNYSKFWARFKEWALTTNDEVILPHKLRKIVEIIKRNPDITLVRLAGYLDTDALYLARYLRNSYKNIVET
ncbi:hypothetical protein SULI_03910 [Saccharolobus solfataricus]|uniref:Uncharacterized protein n=3 Tax=Saccharolobus solfataricus TaxID=2287 RepID=Q97UM2_SACS2|nr:hypothetical protein [Saccharolobus solfataricus]AAK43086.1 Hypothetical protein SSO11614 [Saccharolobus solfataricus P2]AKA73140.1 hypothetical protein SULB_0768 [Saccharolobus solfataricus]AKA75838.1 hypothetical protein SULC_0766 [Saccharolobus solfataricus]AKA78530.1 hypothetical protein SULA_0766 [Saccharolobus solfataricus]AZF67641.1 hypothetical protein SULG_03910 [Saccharolobus solfataricus]